MFLFVVCVDYVYDVLGFGCYLICFWVSYCCEVWLIFGPGLEAGHGFQVIVVSFWAFFVYVILFFPEFINEFSVCFVNDC